MREAEGARIGVSPLATMAAMCPGIQGLLKVCTTRGVLGRALQGGNHTYGGVEEVGRNAEKSLRPENKKAMENMEKKEIKKQVVKSEGKGPEWPYYTAGL